MMAQRAKNALFYFATRGFNFATRKTNFDTPEAPTVYISIINILFVAGQFFTLCCK